MHIFTRWAGQTTDRYTALYPSFAIKLEVVSDNAVIERSSVILPSKTGLYQSDSSFKSISGFHQSKTNHCTHVFLLHSPFWMGLP